MVAAKIDSGEWGNFIFRAAVYCDGRCITEDFLGNSVYADPMEFRDHVGLAAKSRADGCTYGSYFKDMVRTVVSDARDVLCAAPRMRCRS
jgi:hypothetical protein